MNENKKTKYEKLLKYIELSKNNINFFDEIENIIPQSELDNLNEFNLSDIQEILGIDCIVNKTKQLYKGFKEMHHHDFYEILYIKKGKFTFKVDDKQYPVKSGDLLIITPSTLHVLIKEDDNESERIVFNIAQKFIDNLSSTKTNLSTIFKKVEDTKNYVINFKNERITKLDSYINTILKTQTLEQFGADLLFKNAVTSVLLLINDELNNPDNNDILSTNKIVEKCVDYIENNINKTITINDIANSLNLSASTISHTFKNQTGLSIHRYILKKRMILAKQLIKDHINLQEVSILCGFNDYTTFFRCFKKEFNVTPKDFYKNFIIINK